ncbi:MAG: hypothetical protein AAGD40_10850, partial [Pseudomonadota bacterium]
SYNAQLPGVRWPLDHVFFSDSFALIDFRTLDPVGSDHFPISATLCLKPQMELVQDEPRPDLDAFEDAADQLDKGMEQQRDEMASGEDEVLAP